MLSICCLILNYNDYETTLALLSKIIDYKELTNIVIIDNKSTNDSFKILSEHSSSKVHVIQTPQNGGYGYGNNYGIRYSYNELKADQLLIANPDVAFSEKCVQEMSSALNEDKSCAVVCPIPYTSRGIAQTNAAWRLPSAFLYIMATSIMANKIFGTIYYKKKHFAGKHKYFVDCVPGSLLMVDTQIMTQNGMYDEDIFLYCEETVLGYKFKMSGFKTAVLPNSSYIHYHSVSINKSYTSIMQKQQILYKSKLTVLKKYFALNRIQIMLVKAFFAYCSLELRFIDFLRRARE